MGVNDESEQTSEGVSERASAKPHAHRVAALGRSDHDVVRFTGKRAELASLQAQLRAARDRGDIEQERAVATKLARRLVSTGSQWDQATRLARRSLLLGEDPKLREELSSWFASMGRLGLAAGTLEPLLDRQLSATDRARLWTRIAVLRARASEAEASAEALSQAAKADRSDPLALELYAAMRTFVPQTVSQAQATDVLIVASNLRDANGDERAALEDLLQALNVNPGHLPAVERMARHLTSVARPQAADEVWRRAAGTLPLHDERTLHIHRRRIRDALEAQLPAVALGAALDLEADRELSVEAITDAVDLINDGAGFVPIPTFDGLLHCLGLTDLLLARAQRVAHRSKPDVCAELTLHCARVLSGPLGQREQLAWLLSECLLLVPGADAVFAALSEYATAAGDLSCVVDTIVALGRLRMDHPATHRRLEQLAFLSERELRDPSAGTWALQLLADRAPLSSDLTELLQRLASRVEAIEVPASGTWKNVSLPELRRLIDVLAQRPQRVNEYAEALAEMCERDPEGIRWFRLRERLWWSQGLEAEVQRMWRGELVKGRLDGSVCRLGLLRSFRRAGQAERTLQLMAEVTTPTLEEAAHYVSAAGELGSDAERLRAWELLAECAKPAVASVLWAYVSGLWLRCGGPERAVETAERACRADPQSARAFVTCAEALGDADSRVAGLVLERASRVVLPRVNWCRSLARIAELQGNAVQRLKWLRRWASLAPLDTSAASALLVELCARNEAEPLEAALDWLLGQPRPRQELLVAVCDATVRLVELAPERGAGFARRLIGVFGLADERLLQGLKTVAERTQDHQLSLAILERQMVFAAGAREQVVLLLEAFEHRAKAGEPELAVDCLARALSLGGPPEELFRRLESLEPRSTSDAYLQELAIRLACARKGNTEAASALELELALGYRDLASDRSQAVAILTPNDWARNASEAEQCFARWTLVLGIHDAVRHLQRQLESKPLSVRQPWLRAASHRAISEGERELAVETAFAALEVAPLQTDVLAIVESAIPTEDSETLERAYRLVERGVLGVYGERALHYRAACEFERRGDRVRALQHAEGAFLAIPGHGIAFALMSRLADALGCAERVAEVMRQASEIAPDTEQRQYWLGHATSVAEDRVAELRERVDLLLRALAVRADADSVRQISSLCSEILEHAPEQRARLRDSFDSAIRVALRGCEPHVGSATALAAGTFAAEVLGEHALAFSYVALAVELDAARPELAAWAVALGERQAAPARVLLEPVVAAFQSGRAIHPDLLLACRRLAEADRAALPTIAVAVAVAHPQDVEMLAFARKVASNEPALLRRLEEAVPPIERAMAILRDVEAVEGPANRAARLDASVRRLASHTEWFAPVFECLRKLAESSDAQEQVEGTLAYLVNQEDIAVAQRAEAARLWVELLTKRDNHVGALEVFTRIAQWRCMTSADQRWAAAVAQLAGDEEQELAFLGQWELRDRTDGAQSSSAERVAVLSRIAELHAAMGSRMQARHYYERVLFLSPGHETAERFLIEDAERTEDYTVVAKRLEEQLLASRGEPAVALKLSQVYVQRLNAPDKARAALEHALRLYGDDEELLCALGELLDEMGQDAGAAAMYQRASRGSRQLHRASHLAELACRSYLRAGLDEPVKQILAVKGLYPNTQGLAEMRVEVARKQGNDEDVVAALEELSVVSKEPSLIRAEYLLEASETALYQLGDLDRALALAERGARMAPSHLPLQLLSRMLQYRKRGVGSRQDALYTITELRSIIPGRAEEQRPGTASVEWKEASQAEIRVFLLAEALAKRSGVGAGLKELREVEKAYGALPLVDLAIGERLARSDVATEKEQGLFYLERALNGDFRQLRSRDQVALDAAVLALKLGQAERAVTLALRVNKDSEFGAGARELVASIDASQPGLVRRLMGAEVGSKRGVVALGKVALKQVPANLARSGTKPTEASPAPNSVPEPLPAAVAPDIEAGVPEHQGSSEGPALSPAAGAMPSNQTVDEGAAAKEVSNVEPAAQFEPPVDVAAADHGTTEALPTDTTHAAESADTSALVDTAALADTAAQMAPSFDASKYARPGVDVGGFEVTSPLQPIASDPFAAAKDELQRLESQPPVFETTSRMPRAVPPPKPSLQKAPHPAKNLHAKAPPKRKAEPRSPSVVVSRNVAIGPDPRQRRADPLSQPPPSAQRSLAPNSEVERGLTTALAAGSVGAGRELLDLLRKDGARTRETLAACRLLAHWAPGDEQILGQLREAAQKDNDPIYARALLHVQRTLQEPARSPAAPPLHRQSEHVDSMVKLLAGPTQAGCEALGILWQHLPELFREDQPDVASERRVDVGGGNALGELVLELGRLFGCARVGLFQTKQPGPPEFELILSQPSALSIKGEVDPDSPHFRYHLGRMLFATRAEYALIVGLEPEELRTVLGAVGVGFGPPRRLAGDVSQIAHLAERFWELLPPQVQRRLGELCEQPHVLEPEWVEEGARRALNRAGLFACGDLGVAIREVATAAGISLTDRSLRSLCEESEAIADLVRFATSLEYADARWRSGSARSSSEDLVIRAQ